MNNCYVYVFGWQTSSDTELQYEVCRPNVSHQRIMTSSPIHWDVGIDMLEHLCLQVKVHVRLTMAGVNSCASRCPTPRTPSVDARQGHSQPTGKLAKVNTTVPMQYMYQCNTFPHSRQGSSLLNQCSDFHHKIAVYWADIIPSSQMTK